MAAEVSEIVSSVNSAIGSEHKFTLGMVQTVLNENIEKLNSIQGTVDLVQQAELLSKRQGVTFESAYSYLLGRTLTVPGENRARPMPDTVPLEM